MSELVIEYRRETSAYQCIHCLVRSLSGLETIVHLVRPGTHLHSPDEVGVDIGLLVEVR